MGGMAQRGQASVEFALVVLVFLLIVTATVDLARAQLAAASVAQAAREAARYGAVHLGEPDWQAQAAQAGRNLAVGVDGDRLVLAVEQTADDLLVYVAVTGSYPFHTLTPLVGALVGDPILIETSTRAVAG